MPAIQTGNAATPRLKHVELGGGIVINVEGDEWVTVAAASDGTDRSKVSPRLVVLRNQIDKRALICVENYALGVNCGGLVAPNTAPVRAMLRCAQCSDVDPVDKEWRGVGEGFAG
jgi:hypothetical protein